MRVFAAVLLLAGLGVLCGVASADTVPLPPVPTVPTVTVPALGNRTITWRDGLPLTP